MRIRVANARVVDGTGSPAFRADVVIEDGHVLSIGGVEGAVDRTLDAGGAVLAPGFIDVHSHADFTLPSDPLATAKVLQGITTEVVGNCGLGTSPSNETVERFYDRLAPMIFGERSGHCFPDLRTQRSALEGRGISVNAVPLVPHGNVRCAVLGLEERAPSAAELDRMRELVAEAMGQGAFGLSTGLVYAPGAYATTEEIVELAKVAGRHGGLYATHMRDEGSRLVESVEEAIRIGTEAKVPLQISHHKAGGRFNWGKVKKTLRLVEEARERGLDVTSDVYPYTAGSTVLSAMFVPLWAFEGSQERLLERLKDPAMRTRIVADTKERLMKFAQLPGILDRIFPKRLILPFVVKELSKVVVVSSAKDHPEIEGKSLFEIARARKKDVFEVILDLLVESELAVAAIAHVMSEDDVRMVLSHPTTMVGTDGFPQKEGKPHPRTYGTHPRVLEHYVREEKLLSLEQAVHKMTGLVARKFGLEDRGVIRPGARADLVLFDPEQIHDRATYADPKNAPDGIRCVIVNGEVTAEDGKHTGARAGRVLVRAA